MSIDAAQPLRSANPGIVPPWLQPGGGPLAPAPVAPPVTPPAAPELSIGGFSTGFDRPRVGVQSRTDALDAEQRYLEAVVADVQAKFAQLGVRPEEGNDEVVARFNPRFPNAAYTPDGDPARGIPADSITVGVDPRSMTPFSRSEDVVAHELGHRVIDHMTAEKLDLSPLSEDVAIHESLADTMAAIIDDDWVIGDDLDKPIRVMNDPEQLGHPDNVDDLKRVLAPDSPFMVPVGTDRRTGREVLAPDWHVVAGIPNKAASIIGDELGRDALGKIYVKAMREHLRPGQEIEGLADAVLRSTEELYGAGSHELQVTRDAWDAVGVLDLLPAQR